MKFSTKSTYGLRAMAKLAFESKQKPVSLAVISAEENISQGYLERIFTGLKKAKLVKSVKGAGGGYVLAADPVQISAYDIIKATEGEIALFYCLDEKGKRYCSQACGCSVNKVLKGVQESVKSTLREIKLSQLK